MSVARSVAAIFTGVGGLTVAALLGWGTVLGAPGDTERVSVSTGGGEGSGPQGSFSPDISADGLVVTFQSLHNDLVSMDTNNTWDVFVHDRQSGVTKRVSVNSSGNQGNFESRLPAISRDGRFVAFESIASNLVLSDSNNQFDVFVHDLQTSVTERVSVSTGGQQGNFESQSAAINADGNFVCFSSSASNLVGGDTNGNPDAFVRDRSMGTTERVSVGYLGQGDSYSNCLDISADGNLVVFLSGATNLVPGDTQGFQDVFVRDRQAGTTERVSVDSSGAAANDHSFSGKISANGRFVAITSSASNLVLDDTNNQQDVFVHDRQTGTTERVSVDSGGSEGDSFSSTYRRALSDDGRFAAFESAASNLVPGDTNSQFDAFVRDRQTGVTTRVSVDSSCNQGDSSSFHPAISGDGSFVAFSSIAENLVPGDTNGIPDGWDIFVHEADACPSSVTVAVDIHPQSCPNPLQLRGRGAVTVAITGTTDLDVTEIDPASVRLAGVAPLRSAPEDVTTPFEPFIDKENCQACTNVGPDGFMDLVFTFKNQAIVDAIGPVTKGQCLHLEVTGNLLDGTPILGEDVVVIQK